ncbi:uncharacterized protein LOC132695542 [Cylas formicarius]|uniref:uncharacterized protein LOC132695542 n=1 Tax=Cylas formicarius TaxID=197179 RepID=UPI0029589FF1|nr:uncharacterized protein LOC132695542 [Cylas formicarius]
MTCWSASVDLRKIKRFKTPYLTTAVIVGEVNLFERPSDHQSHKMNAIYVTVSIIPLLLVLAGFNHAHGLTTFGKSNNNPQNNQPQTTATQKQCTIQANCTLIKDATCMKGYCRCGDDQFPINGHCMAKFQGPNHICTKDDDCVENADCILVKELNLNSFVFTPDMMICRCQEGYTEFGATCGGVTFRIGSLSAMFVTIAVFWLI